MKGHSWVAVVYAIIALATVMHGQSGLSTKTGATKSVPTQGAQPSGPQPSPITVQLVEPSNPPKTGILEWVQAWGPVLAFLGIFITAYFTLRRGRMDARYSYASEILKFRLRQVEEFYAPALLYIEQSRKVYDKLRWTIEREKKDIAIGEFRLLDYIYDFKRNETFKPLVERILGIGNDLTRLISEKSGLIEGGVTTTFVEYQAHFEILNAASEQVLNKEQKEGWHRLGYYPRLLNRELREGYNVVLAHLDNYANAGDKIICELLKQKAVQIGKYRRQLIDNLRFYEEHAKEYGAKFDRFDLSIIRQQFVEEIERARAQGESPGNGIVRILDAGCGTGRDAYEFLKKGYAVTAIDASPAMLRECTKKIRDARHNGESAEMKQAATASHWFEMTFQEIGFRSEFDGVWAAASLLHVPSQEIEEAVRGLIQALKPNGILYMSFKFGCGEQVRDARFYSYYGRRDIRRLLKRIVGAEEKRVWLSDMQGRNLTPVKQWWAWCLESVNRYDRSYWLNVLATRKRV